MQRVSDNIAKEAKQTQVGIEIKISKLWKIKWHMYTNYAYNYCLIITDPHTPVCVSDFVNIGTYRLSYSVGS